MSAESQEQRVEQQDRWLSQCTEEALEPAQKICDPHHHLWDYPNNRYLSEEFLRDVNGGHRIVSSVYVECVSAYRTGGSLAMRPLGETQFVDRLADTATSASADGFRFCEGIVGFADLCLGDQVAEVLDAHLAASNRLRGIRHAAAWDASPLVHEAHTRPGPQLLGNPAFRRGFSQLAPRQLSFDVWIFHPQLGDVIALARAFPDTTIVLDHLGGPIGIGPYAGKQEEVFACWKKLIRELARCPNVYLKLGGIHMSVNGWGWHRQSKPPSSSELARSTGHYYLHAIECFGMERCMFESNFPADRISVSYTVLWNTFKRIAGAFSPEEKNALFHDTAVRVYRCRPG